MVDGGLEDLIKASNPGGAGHAQEAWWNDPACRHLRIGKICRRGCAESKGVALVFQMKSSRPATPQVALSGGASTPPTDRYGPKDRSAMHIEAMQDLFRKVMQSPPMRLLREQHPAWHAMAWRNEHASGASKASKKDPVGRNSCDRLEWEIERLMERLMRADATDTMFGGGALCDLQYVQIFRWGHKNPIQIHANYHGVDRGHLGLIVEGEKVFLGSIVFNSPDAAKDHAAATAPSAHLTMRVSAELGGVQDPMYLHAAAQTLGDARTNTRTDARGVARGEVGGDSDVEAAALRTLELFHQMIRSGAVAPKARDAVGALAIWEATRGACPTLPEAG